MSVEWASCKKVHSSQSGKGKKQNRVSHSPVSRCMSQQLLRNSYKQLLRYAKQFDAQPILKVPPLPSHQRRSSCCPT